MNKEYLVIREQRVIDYEGLIIVSIYEVGGINHCYYLMKREGENIIKINTWEIIKGFYWSFFLQGFKRRIYFLKTHNFIPQVSK